jgi:hypothetical protein
MSTLAQKDSEQNSSRQRGSSHCQTLIDAATKDLFRKNAFRITGLSVDATKRQREKQAQELMIRVECGQDPHPQGGPFPMKPPPTLDEIREAIGNLHDPEQRLINEFFWFWPEEFGNSQSDSAMQALAKGDSETAIEIWTARENGAVSSATAKHNLALVYHVCALDWENYAVKNAVEADRREKMTNYWKGALKRWETLATNDQFWEQVVARIRQLNEPNLLPGFARSMRAALPEALDKINAELAVAFAESGKFEIARLHVQIMREAHQGSHNFGKTAELVLTPAKNRLKQQIQRAQGIAKKASQDGASAAWELLQQARSVLPLYDVFFDKDSDMRNELFGEVAAVCNRLQIDYYKATRDDKTCLEILKAVLPLATSIDLRREIEKDINDTFRRLELLAVNKKLEPVYTLLKSLQESKEHPRSRLRRFHADIANGLISATAGLPQGSENRERLFDAAAIVLREISLDAWNTHKDRGTALAAQQLALRYAITPELKQRLAEDAITLQQLGVQIVAAAAAKRAKLRNSVLYGWAAIIAIIIVWNSIDSCHSTGSTSRNSSYPPPTIPSAPAYAPPAPSPPAYTPPPTFGSGNPAGNLYRVPSSVSSALDNEKAEIESERATLEALDVQVETLGREIERDRIYLDHTSHFAVDEFNTKVDRYNALAQKAKTANAAFNEKVDNYNAKLQQYGH